MKIADGAAGDPYRNRPCAEKIRQEVESLSDTSLFVSVAFSLKNVAVPAAHYSAGRLIRHCVKSTPNWRRFSNTAISLLRRAEDLGLVTKISPQFVKIAAEGSAGDANCPAIACPVRNAWRTATKPMRIRVGGNVQAAMLTKRVEPVYPPAAIEARVMGIVKLSVIISQEGKVQQIQVESGHPLFVPAAIEAVKQWEYKPTLLNGKPVEVVTVVEVVFDLPASQ